MAGVVKAMDSALKSMNLEKVNSKIMQNCAWLSVSILIYFKF